MESLFNEVVLLSRILFLLTDITLNKVRGICWNHLVRDKMEIRQNCLFTRVIDNHNYMLFFFFFYIQPSPKQGTTPDLMIHTHIF